MKRGTVDRDHHNSNELDRGKREFLTTKQENKMIKLFFLGLCLILTNCSTIEVGVIGNKKEVRSMKKIAILPFETDNAPTSQELIDALQLYFIKTGKIEVLERDKKYIDKILQEQHFSREALVDQQTAAEMGKFLGVDAIVLGKAQTMDASNVCKEVDAPKERGTADPLKSTVVVAQNKLDTFSFKILNVESGLILVNVRKTKGIEWSVPLVLKRIFGFGYFWTTKDIVSDSSDVNYLSQRTVDKISKEIDAVSKLPDPK